MRLSVADRDLKDTRSGGAAFTRESVWVIDIQWCACVAVDKSIYACLGFYKLLLGQAANE